MVTFELFSVRFALLLSFYILSYVSGSLDLLESWEPVQACNGIALHKRVFSLKVLSTQTQRLVCEGRETRYLDTNEINQTLHVPTGYCHGTLCSTLKLRHIFFWIFSVFFVSTGRLFIILFHFWRVEKVAEHWLTLVNPSKTEMIDKCVKLMSTGRDFHNE